MILSSGSLIDDRYEILRIIGSGSSANVYEARQISTDQRVAIKVLNLDGGEASVERRISRFEREMSICAGLAHPHIVPLIDSGVVPDGPCYAVFQRIPGKTLTDVLADEGRLDTRETVRLMEQALDALACAHASGIVHRDFKPDNVMVSGTGARRNAYVLDFGLGGATEGRERARWRSLTQAREFVGTPFYAAPEQLLGDTATVRSDLYAWALVLLETITGRHPFDDLEPIAWMQGEQQVVVPGWLLAHPLGALLQRATDPDPNRRAVEVPDLMRALERAISDEIEAPGPDDARRPAAGERRPVAIVSARVATLASGATEFGREERDEIASELIDLCAKTGERAGGRVVARVGNRVLLGFGVPRAREDDASRAVQAALEIADRVRERGEALRGVEANVHLGVHAGLLIVRGSHGGGTLDTTGEVNEIASSLDRLAGPGQIVATDALHRRLRRKFGTRPFEGRVEGALAAEGPLYRVERGAPVAPAPELPFVGRQIALEQLRAARAQAGEGEPRAFLVQGEAGIGKSRLLRELRRESGDGPWLGCRCVPENQHAPLSPFVDLLRSLAGSVDELLERFDLPREPDAALLATLLGEDTAQEALPVSRERHRDLVLDLLVRLLVQAEPGSRATAIVAVEDVHWADPTSLELLTRLAQELASQRAAGGSDARVLVLLTARPEFASPWADDVSLLPLDRLTRADVEQMVRLGSPGDVPSALIESVIGRADGVPLFVEELRRVLEEKGSPRLLTESVGDLEIPTSLQSLLNARLDALSPHAYESAQIASALGREIRLDLLRVVSPRDEIGLQRDLDELVRTGLGFPRRRRDLETFVFKHALVRDTAYASMLISTRRAWHARIADALVATFPRLADERPDLVALHLGEAERPEESASWWKRAGERASVRGAHREALHHAERGLATLERLPDSRERAHLELALCEVRGTALFSTLGYGAPEVEETFARARELCDRLGDAVPPRVFWGTFAVQFTRGDREAVDALIPQVQRIAEGSRDPVSLLSAHTLAGAACFVRGDFPSARSELEMAMRWYATDAFQHFVGECGYDPGMYTFSYLMDSVCVLGDLDRSVSLRDEMIACAEKAGNPYSLGIALAFALNHARELGDVDTAIAMAQREIAFATEQHLYFWLAPATCTLGWGVLQHGDAERAIGMIEQGLEMCRSFGVRSTYPYFLSGLVEAHGEAGNFEAGLAVADEALGMCERYLDRFYESELLRNKGEILALAGETERAERCLEQGLAMARKRNARFYALRTATSLLRLRRARGVTGNEEELRSMLAGFREGLETRYLREAAALLAETPGGLTPG